jgi:hypothetical protein
LSMKNKLLGIASILSLAALIFVFLGCPVKKPIVEGKYGITIRPKKDGYPKFEAKWKDIQSVLNEYPYLYYIEEFKDGDLVGDPLGNSCNLFPLANLERVKKAAKEMVPAYTGHAVQIGIGLSQAVEDSECLGGDNCPEDETLESHSPQAHYKKYIQDSKEMTKKINEILDGSDAAGSTPGN